MRKVLAIMLATCLGVLLPAAAMPLRVCLLEPMEQADGCCNSCSTGHRDCCADVKLLPDAPMPEGNFETPAFVGYAIPSAMAELPRIPVSIAPPIDFTHARTGVGPPTARLAVWNVWRL
ncbi:MAG: hypothetical protein ACO3JG_03210 [Luteolibacter sp.]